ncbi:MAG: fatty acid desaturase [Pleurocapsa sp.]
MFNASTSASNHSQTNSPIGLAVASIIIFLWFASLIGFLTLDITQIPLILIILGVLLRSFLHTGLFITTHEAIHGVISKHRPINDFLGLATSLLYALLPYKVLAENHRLHHRYPATEKDPDFHSSDSNNFLLWYGNFMKEYQKGRQGWVLLIGMAIIFGFLICLRISSINIFLFWVIPIVISSMQLFTFGIWFPHRQTELGYSDRHRANSNNYSVFWSFITCYHFGYHWEHHQYPYLPWYKLPLARQNHQKYLDLSPRSGCLIKLKSPNYSHS